MQLIIETTDKGVSYGVDQSDAETMESKNLRPYIHLASQKFRELAEKENFPKEGRAIVVFDVDSNKIRQVLDVDSHEHLGLKPKNISTIKRFVEAFNAVIDENPDPEDLAKRQRLSLKTDLNSWSGLNQEVAPDLVNMLEFFEENQVQLMGFSGTLFKLQAELAIKGEIAPPDAVRVQAKVDAIRELGENLQDFELLLDDAEEREDLVKGYLNDSGFKTRLEQSLVMAVYKHTQEQDVLSSKVRDPENPEIPMLPLFEFWSMIWLLTGFTMGVVPARHFLDEQLKAWFGEKCSKYVSMDDSVLSLEDTMTIQGLPWLSIPTPLSIILEVLTDA